MKKCLFLSLITILLMGCTESKVRNTATEYIKNQMKDPSSFKTEKVEVLLDSIPLYLNHVILSQAKETKKALKDYAYYKDRDFSLWWKEISQAREKLDISLKTLKTTYEIARDIEVPEELKKKDAKDTSIEYMVLIKCSANNSYGGTVSSKYIVIVDKENNDEVLGYYGIDEDFLENVYTIFYTVDELKDKIKQNQFGKIETEGMTQVEQFIFSD